MGQYKRTIVWLCVVSLIMSGCVTQHELNHLAVVTAVGIDSKGEDEIEVHLQIVNPTGDVAQRGAQGGGGVGGPIYTYTTSGRSPVEALNMAKNTIPRELFLAHVYFLVLGEKFARERGFRDLIDFIERDAEMRGNFLILVADDYEAKDILQSYTPIEKNPGRELDKRMKVTGGSIGLTDGIRFRDIVRWRYNDNRQIVVLGMKPGTVSSEAKKVEELEHVDANRNAYRLTGLGIFRGDRLVDWMTLEESLGWTIINNKLNEDIMVRVPCDGGEGSLGVLLKGMKTKVRPNVKGEQITFTVNVTGKAILEEIVCSQYTVSDPNTIPQLQRLVEKKLAEDVMSAVNKAKQNEVDIFGFGRKLYQKYPEVWKEHEHHWQRHVTQLQVSPHFSIQIEQTGARLNSVHEQNR